MKSLYKRELAMMVGIVTLSFTLLSTAFMLLSYRYIISETRDRLERNAGYIASATGNYLRISTAGIYLTAVRTPGFSIRQLWRRCPLSPTPRSL